MSARSTVETSSDDAASRAYSRFGLSAQSFWSATAEERETTFAQLREHDPVSWQPPIENPVVPNPDDVGYWAVVRHSDITYVSKNSDLFISGEGVIFDDLPAEFLEMTQSFMAMDPPRHQHLRGLVGKAFTPKQIGRIEDHVARAAKEVVDGFASEPSGRVEFIARCARLLPLRMFSLMFGIPEHLQERTGRAAEEVVSWADPDHLRGRDPAVVQFEAAHELHAIAREICEQRRAEPGEDLFTNLVQARIDGEGLTDDEIAAFFVLLSVGANDTTRHTSALTVRALTDHPDQREWLLNDFDGRIHTAVEEFIRFATPVMNFRRTATADTELGGRTIRAGEKVVMFYSSGNCDETVFDRPRVFDVSRSPNPHVGFGGGGRHMCLGNQLAKSMLRSLFRQLLLRIPDIHAVAEPELLGTNFIRGVKALDVAFTPEPS